MKNSHKTLVLFDIDGTLTQVTDKSIAYWEFRLRAVFEETYHVPVTIPLDVNSYNGMVDKKIMWKIAQLVGISRERFDEKFLEGRDVFHKYLKAAVKDGSITYAPIQDAMQLVRRLPPPPAIYYGLVTGNVEKNAWLKLKNAGYDGHFHFGAFGDSMEEREDLVREGIAQAKKRFGRTFLAEEVVVIGDTVHDIRAAKAAGVMALGVATGHLDTVASLIAAGADLAVSSLLDERVLTLLGLSQ